MDIMVKSKEVGGSGTKKKEISKTLNREMEKLGEVSI